MKAKTPVLYILLCAFFILGGFDYADFAKRADMEWIYSGQPGASQFNTVKLTAVGDLMAHGKQAEDALRKGGGVYNYNYAFSYVRKYFNNSDIVYGNLETVLNGSYSDYPLFSVTDEYAQALKNAGFNLLSTANNHTLDQREEGLLRTLEVLDGLGIAHTGSFSSQERRDDVMIIEENGITFALLAYSYGTNGIPVPEGKDYLINLLDAERAAADIARAKELNPDFIIVFPHMGVEYETRTRQEYKDIAASLFAAGADIVLSSHPHVVQPCEVVTVTDPDGSERTCFAAYSLGNFISGQRTKPRDAGVIYNLYFNRDASGQANLSRITFVPTWVKYYGDEPDLDIAVLPIYDALTSAFWGESGALSEDDLARLQEAHLETAATISGQSIPLEDIQPEYTIYQAEEDF